MSNTRPPLPDPATILFPAQGKMHRHRHWFFIAAATALVVLTSIIWRSCNGDPAITYKTETVARGNLLVTVSATGNLQPTNKVDVGSELSGTIKTVLVDDNDTVSKGQILARLDISKLQDQVSQSRASLAVAEAQVLQAQENL